MRFESDGSLANMRRFGGIRPLVNWLAILCYVLVASGLPIPLGGMREEGRSGRGGMVAQKDRSIPFPCMDRPCGCSTAEQCYTKCCCHSPAERLAWARARGLEGVVASLVAMRTGQPAAQSCCESGGEDDTSRSESQTSSQVAASSGTARCCETTSSSSRKSSSTTIGPSASCCESAAIRPVAGPVESPSDPARSGTRTVTLRAMLACGGIVAEWFATGACLPPPQPVSVSTLAISSESFVLFDESALCVRPAPEAPPPRVV